MMKNLGQLYLVFVLVNSNLLLGADRAAQVSYISKIYRAINNAQGKPPVGEDIETLANIDLTMFDGTGACLPLVYATRRASFFGNEQTVAFLLDHGHAADQHHAADQYTALHTAVFNSNEPLVRLLAERGARLDLRTKIFFNSTPLLVTPVELACKMKGIALHERSIYPSGRLAEKCKNECIKTGRIAKFLVKQRDGEPDDPLY